LINETFVDPDEPPDLVTPDFAFNAGIFTTEGKKIIGHPVI